MSVLHRIFEDRRRDVAEAKIRVSEADLRAMIADLPPARGFLRALKSRKKDLALIAEIKPASPSQGAIAPDLDPAAVAKDYASAGAHALSVLTEPHYFSGKAENLMAAREATSLPALRKDFLDDPYQIYESRAWGADAVLLIVAALEISQLKNLYELANELSMDVLVEVHSEAEAEAAVEIGADMIGVNARDLNTLQTDLSVVEKLIPQLNDRAFCVAESALSRAEDVERVKRAGADAVLIGTAFCGSPDIPSKVREVMGWPCG